VRPRLPPALTSRYDDLVCVVGEANAWPYLQGRPNIPDELVHWVAIRPSTGERFEQLATPEHGLSPNTAFQPRLGRTQPRYTYTHSTGCATCGFAATRPTNGTKAPSGCG